MQSYDLKIGDSPLILSQPHPGIMLPDGMDKRLTNEARKLPDTDWHIPHLYADCANALNATVISAKYSRYLIDLNRDPKGASLYPGQNVTELCPTGLFDDGPIYLDGEEPGDDEISERIHQYWHPYHSELAKQIERIKNKFGFVLLYDCHSIRSVVPRFFDGTLPDLNIGSGDGSSTDQTLVDRLGNDLSACKYSHIINGRFKGGYITRHYGKPDNRIHAIQMETAQSAYMQEEFPFAYDDAAAAALKPVLHTLLTTMLVWGLQSFGTHEGYVHE